AIVFVAITGMVCMIGYRFYVRPATIKVRLGQPAYAVRAVEEKAQPISERIAVLLNKLGGILPMIGAGNEVRRDLSMAGYRSAGAPQVFVGVRLTALVLLSLGALAVPIGPDSNPALRMIMLVGGVGIGWRIPGFLLKKRIAARQQRLRSALPDALDLIIISVEAGLGLDQAIQHVAGELQGRESGELGEELQLIGMEMRAGMRRADALSSFAERTGEEEIQKLVAILIQSDRFGTSMGEAMRNHSQYMRVARRQQADERAAKVGVKLVFPIFFFILPSMMLIAAGPGLLQIFKYLFPMMKQIH
ncbi:MAG: type secretion system protein, partial [Bryobacterales bacterium]|nr:type secretion system protein [Bryobacterales bacterium]